MSQKKVSHFFEIYLHNLYTYILSGFKKSKKKELIPEKIHYIRTFPPQM